LRRLTVLLQRIEADKMEAGKKNAVDYKHMQELACIIWSQILVVSEMFLKAREDGEAL
jgi:hypothetical protein